MTDSGGHRELRLLAHMSRDPVLVEAFRRGEDIHTRTAAEVFKVAPKGNYVLVGGSPTDNNAKLFKHYAGLIGTEYDLATA